MKLSNLFTILIIVIAVESAVHSTIHSAEYLKPDISYINSTPVIDGKLDSTITLLAPREFYPYTYKSHPDNPEVTARYYLAYGTDYLYLFLEVDSDTFVCRDRGFQNGDGLVLSITTPRFANSPGEEYYLLGFYPSKKKDDPFKKLNWIYNGIHVFADLSSDCRFVVKSQNGHVGYEILLPWKDVFPYHPLLSEAIGFNLIFVKAVGDDQSSMIGAVLNKYFDYFQNLTLYSKLSFKPPQKVTGVRSYVVMNRNCYEGETIEAKIVTVSAGQHKEKIQFSIRSVTGELKHTEIYELETTSVSHYSVFTLKTDLLLPGDYVVEWNSLFGHSAGKIPLSVFPYLDYTQLYDRLENSKQVLQPGSYNTILFLLDELLKDREHIKPYEYASDWRQRLEKILTIMDDAEAGNDLLAQRTGLFRRAFESTVDRELHPYSVRIPESFDRDKKYPLVVFLHGSDRDDRALADHSHYISNDRFIQIAPHGRGDRNCYTVKEAQIDIREAIADAIKNYPIDESNIVLAGFSMGGYGVCRTFWETPQRFKAVAIFSGQPNLASVYFPGESHPNFLYDEILDVFTDIPMFIYHGKEDRTAPHELAAKVVSKLTAAGAKVEFVTDAGKGHELPSKAAVSRYHRWLHNILLQK